MKPDEMQWLKSFGLILSGFLFSALTLAQDLYDSQLPVNQVSYTQNEEGLYVASVALHTPEELQELFDRAEDYLSENQSYSESSPIEVILHGPEVRVFQRKNYGQYKMLVDQAARLDAYNIIDVRVCELWMSADQVQASELPPFVDTVPNGPAYKNQLLKQGYSNF